MVRDVRTWAAVYEERAVLDRELPRVCFVFRSKEYSGMLAAATATTTTTTTVDQLVTFLKYMRVAVFSLVPKIPLILFYMSFLYAVLATRQL